MIPDRLTAALADRYRIERELGKGGMATVYLAHDLKHERDVAIKVLHPDLGAVLGAERFLSEIKTTAKLQHPHILPLLDSGEAAGFLYYVMPVVTGETLRARLERERQLPVPEAVRIAREVASALDYAHRQGVIHRDIKPENILLHDGQALVADFGIALAVQSAGGQRMTQTGLSLGTPQYMSPEQAMGERSIDARSDVYALGAVTYEMLTGDPPFTGSSVQAIVAKVLNERPTSPSTVRDTVPAGVEQAVMTALAKLPADRFATAAEFAAALVNPSASFTAAVRVAPRRNVPALALGAVAAVSLIAAAWGWLRPQPPALVVRYRIALDSIPETRDWTGRIAISPDGELIVHAGGLNGRLLVRRRDELGFTAMPATEGARSPFFSFDGRQIAYMVGNRLMVGPLAGGPPVVFADSLDAGQAPTWGADGFIYGIKRASQRYYGVWRMRAVPGASIEKVTEVDSTAGESFHDRVELLPDGRSMLFYIQSWTGSEMIALGDIRSGTYTELIEGVRARYARNGRILYATRDGTLWSVPFDVSSRKLAGTPTRVAERLRNTLVGPADFVVSTTGTLAYVTDDASDQRELAWVSRDGTAVEVDAEWHGSFVNPVLSPDGTRLAVTVREGGSSDIWVRRTAGGQPSKLTFGDAASASPAWTPDGRGVTYVHGTSPTGNIFLKRPDGGDLPVRLLQSPRAISEQVWSPTGDWLVARTTTPTTGAGDIIALRAAEGSTPVSVAASRSSEYSPTISPDGRWMAYVSNETGAYQVNVVPFPESGTSKWQISTRGGTAPRWSNGGGEIFYIDGESNFVSARVATAPSFSVGESTVLFNSAGFVSEGVSRRNYDVSPDDRRFLMIRRAPGSASAQQLVVVENWFSELKSKVP